VKTHDFYLGFALSPAHLEAFLQRQPPLTRKILERRLNRFHLVAFFPQRLFPCSLHALLISIQDRYKPKFNSTKSRLRQIWPLRDDRGENTLSSQDA
jgi:hypothetical protein